MLIIFLHFLAFIVITSGAFNVQSSLTGFFWIQHSITHRVLDVEMGSNKPGANVLLWEPKKVGYDNQLWKYEDEVFVNKRSGLVLYLPSVGDQVVRGTSLIQAEPIDRDVDGGDEDPIERYKRSWGVDPQGRIFSWLDINFCVAPGEGVSVVVEDCFFGDVDDMVWRFVPAQPASSFRE